MNEQEQNRILRNALELLRDDYPTDAASKRLLIDTALAQADALERNVCTCRTHEDFGSELWGTYTDKQKDIVQRTRELVERTARMCCAVHGKKGQNS